MRELSRRVFRSAVFWNYLAVALRSGAAIFLLPLALRRLSSDEMGLWYLFMSIAGLANLLDLGFGSSLNRSTSYLWAGASRLMPLGIDRSKDESPIAAGATPNYELLSKLIATMRWFYLSLGILLFLVLEFGGGAWIWSQSTSLEHASSIRGAWAVFAFGCALNTIGNFWPTLLTGINGVREAQKVFLVSLVANYVFSIGGLLAGWGLWALVAGQVSMGLISRFLGRICFLKLAGTHLDYRHHKPDRQLLRTLWPTSWRLAAITIGLYFLVQANTFLTSVFMDLSTTARYGLSLQVVLFLSQITCVWVMIKMPLISQLRGRHELEEIQQQFIPRVRVFLFGYLAGAVGLYFMGDWLLTNIVGAKTHLLPKPQLLVLIVVIGLESHTALYRELVQTANLNPFVKPILLSALVSVLLAMVLAPQIGIWGILIAPGVAQLCFNNWWIVVTGIRSLEMTGSEYVARLLRFRF